TAILSLIILLMAGPLVMTTDEKERKVGTAVKKAADRPDTFTFKVPVDVVVVSVVASDKSGSPIKDLTVNDFKVYEDGKAVPIHTFALESYKTVHPSESNPKKTAGPEPGVGGKPEEVEPSQSRMI